MADVDDSPEVLRLVAIFERVQALNGRIETLALRTGAAERSIRHAEVLKIEAQKAADEVQLQAAEKMRVTGVRAIEIAATERKRYERERADLFATLAKLEQSNPKAIAVARERVGAQGQMPAGAPPGSTPNAGKPPSPSAERDAKKESLDSPDFPPDWDLYEPVSLLGEGGMGRVYRVFHRGWGIDLAVKVPRKTALDAKAMKSVLREAEAWSSLGLHPFITSCYYARVRDGVPWLFAEFVDGGSLQQAIRSRSLYAGENALERILTVAIQSARGLHHAHERSVVHQDVKPANLLLTLDGITKVTDFGLARAALTPDSSGPRPTVEGTMIVRFSGMTPAYASPEQLASAQGREHAITRRTDVYSWAATVLEMFVGSLSWISGPSAVDALESLLETGPIRGEIPKIPPEVAALLERCFATRQSARPTTLALVADELSQIYHKYCSGFLRDTSSLRQPSADALYNRGASRLDLGDATRALECWSEALHADPVHPQSTFARSVILWRQGKITDDEALRTLKEAITSNEPSWQNAHLLALVHAERGSVQDARAALGELNRLAPNSKDARAAMEHTEPGLRDILRWDREIQTFGVIDQLAFSDDASTVAVVSTREDASQLQLFAYETRALILEYPIPSGVLSLAFDGADVRAATATQIFRLQFSSNTLTLESSHAPGLVALCGASTLTTDQSTVQWLATPSDRARPVAMVLSSPVVLIAVSHTRRYAALCTEDGQLLVMSLAKGSILWRHRYTRSPERLAFSRDEECLYVGGWDDKGARGSVRVHDVQSGTIRQQIYSPSPPLSLALSADENWVIQLAANGVLRLWSNLESRWVRTERSAQGAGRFRQVLCASQKNRVAIARESHLVLATVGDRSTRAAIPILCPSRSEDVFAREQEVFGALTHSREAIARRDWAHAIVAIHSAAAVDGYSRAPAVRRAWEQLALRTQRGAIRGAWTGVSFECPSGAAHTIELSPDGEVLYVVDGEHELYALNARTGAVIHKLLFSDNIHTFQVCPATGVLVVAWGSQLEWIEPVTAKTLQLTTVTMKCRRLALSPDGCSVVLVGAEGFEAIRVQGEQKTSRIFHAKSSQRAAWLADQGPLLTSADGADLAIVSFESGALLGTVPNSTFAMDVVCSADGGYVCAGHRDGWIRLWKVSQSAQLSAARAPELTLVREFASDGVVTGVALSQDGAVLVAVDATGRVQAWDVREGRAFAFGGHETFVHDVALTPCGRVAATGGRDGKARVLWLDWQLVAPEPEGWSPRCAQVLERFCERGFHKLSNAQRLLGWALIHAGCGTVSSQEINNALSAVLT